MFNYIEMFYNPKRRHNTYGDVSPVEFEKRHSHGSEVSSNSGSIQSACKLHVSDICNTVPK